MRRTPGHAGEHPSSAGRAEAQRLTARRTAAGTTSASPASTGRIAIGYTVAFLVTIGAIGLTAPPPPSATSREAAVAAPLQVEAPQPRQQPVDTVEQPERTELGNVAKQYVATASVLSPTGEPVVQSVLGEPGPAQGKRRPKRHPGPHDIQYAVEFVGTDRRSV